MKAKAKARPDPNSPFYTPAELAGFLGISIDTLYRMRGDGVGPPMVRVTPRKVIYLKEDVEHWLQSQRVIRPKPKRRTNNGVPESPVA